MSYIEPIITYPKSIGCNIHGHIKVSNLALKIIDTPEFQRLRDIKQLGLCHYVFPGATHTRFSHSIGVYYLASKVVEKLQKDYPDKIYIIPELGETKLTNFIGELIKIGGLCHDIGHGPFSHVFDSIMEDLTHNQNACHEIRSCLLIEQICKREFNLELSGHHIKFIQSIIKPSSIHMGAIYQIVSNYLNGIDVDKFDYLARDTYSLGLKKGFDPRRIIDEIIINDEGNITYAKHCATEIYDMFQTRYMMHKQVYNHKAGKIIECMIEDIILKINPIFNISDTINNMNEFCKLTDNSIFFLLETVINPLFSFNNIQLNDANLSVIYEAYELYQNIIHRKLYKCVAEIFDATPKYFNNFLTYLEQKDINTYDLQILSTQIGFVSGNNKNPFESIYFYDSKETIYQSSFLLDKRQISTLLCDNYSESRHFLICKNRQIYPKIIEIYNEYQYKVNTLPL